MKLTNAQRELLERALDELGDALHDDEPSGEEIVRLTQLYCQAVAIVRERPAGARRLRSDHNTKRSTPQDRLPL